MSNKIKIGITQGDTNGVGWEVILKIFADARMTELCTPVVYGSSTAATFYARRFKECLEEEVRFNIVDSAERAQSGKVNLVECGSKELYISAGKPSKEGGEAAAAALRAAADDLKEGIIDALVTAPIDKEMIQSAEFPYTGHTEFLAKELDGEPLMIMASELMRVGLVTIHLPVAQVAEAISKELIVKRIKQINDSMRQDFGVVRPRIAVLALNPHAGDGGLLGKEEEIEKNILEKIKESKLPCILVLNKTDMSTPEKIAKTISEYYEYYKFDAVVPTCASKGQGVDAVIEECSKYLVDSEWFFPDDIITDQPEKTIASEVIREKILRTLSDEIPHGTAVVIEDFKDNGKIIKIRAEIYCEKASHKGIIIGKNGETLKRIGSYAREDLERFFGVQVYINLWVKVKEKWRDNTLNLNNLGFNLKEFK